MDIIFKDLLVWVLKPETISGFIAGLLPLILGLPTFLQKLKDSKEKNVINAAVNIALPEIKKLVNSNLSNDKKREEAIRLIYAYLPANSRKFLTADMAIIIVNGIFHGFVKPLLEDKK